jgi:hypothetical protein
MIEVAYMTLQFALAGSDSSREEEGIRMKQYMVSKNGSEMGPLNLGEVIALITDRKIELFDYIFDEAKGDWVLLTEHSDVTSALKAEKPKAPPKVLKSEVKATSPKSANSQGVAQGEQHSVEWFVMKGQSQFGPFGGTELVRLMQEKTVFEFDFVWNSSMKDWKRLAEIPEFSREKIQNFKTAFFKREHPRHPLKGRVIVHNGTDFWMAEGKEISDGGMGLFIKDAMIVPGQVLQFHVQSADGREAFNIKGEIVSKQFVGGARTRSQKVEYGVRFVKESALEKAG